MHSDRVNGEFLRRDEGVVDAGLRMPMTLAWFAGGDRGRVPRPPWDLVEEGTTYVTTVSASVVLASAFLGLRI